MSVERFLEKAIDNLHAAALLFDAGSPESVCNRAYYAMYNAARAALMAIGEERAAFSKTHSGLLSNFSLHIAKPSLVDAKWSGILAQEEKRRLLADYESEAIVLDDAKEAIGHTNEFVAAIVSFVSYRV